MHDTGERNTEASRKGESKDDLGKTKEYDRGRKGRLERRNGTTNVAARSQDGSRRGSEASMREGIGNG